MHSKDYWPASPNSAGNYVELYEFQSPLICNGV